MCALFDSQLAKKRDGASRLHFEIARLQECYLGDTVSAVSHYEKAVREDPSHIASIQGARRALVATGKEQAALRLLEREIALAPDPARKAELLLQKGLLLEGPLKLRKEALGAYEAAAKLAPTDLTVLKSCARAQEEAGSWEPLLETMERIAARLSKHPELQSSYLAQMARIAATKLKKTGRAIELYSAAMGADATGLGVLSNLKALLARQERWKELVEALDQEAELVADPQAKANVRLRQARILTQRVGDMDQGIRALVHATSLVPNDESILSELAELYQRAGKFAELASVEERRIKVLAEPSSAQWNALGELYEYQLQDPDRAITRYCGALAVDPGFRPALLHLQRLREKRSEWSELVEMLGQEAANSSDPHHRAELHCRMASLCERQLASNEFALKHHRKALALVPDFAPSFQALERLLSDSKSWHELVELYERRVEQAFTPEDKLTTLFKIARLEEDALGLPGAAVRSYQRILEQEPKHAEARHSLTRAAERARQFDVMVESLDQEAALTTINPQRLSLWFRAAEVQIDEQGKVEDGVGRLHALLKEEQGHRPAIDLLCRTFYRNGQWAQLLDAYRLELATLKQPEHRAALQVTMAELSERRLGAPDGAIQLYRKAITAAPKNVAPYFALRRLLEGKGAYKEAVELLEAEAELHSVANACGVWLQVAELYEDSLGEPDKALAAYEKAIASDPSSWAAAEGKARLLDQTGNYRGLAQSLVEGAKLARDPMQVTNSLYQAAETERDHLRQLDRAAQGFEKVLERSPGNITALYALDRAYNVLAEPAKRSDALRQLVAVLDAPEAKLAAQYDRVALAQFDQGVSQEARKNLHMELLRLAPSHREGLLGLLELALAGGDRPLTTQIDAKLSALDLDRCSTSVHQTRLAESLEAQGDGAALKLYRAALAADPQNLSAALGITRLAEAAKSPDLLAEAAANERRLLGRPAQAARLLRMAAGALSEAGKPELAADQLIHALATDPNSQEAATALGALLGRGLDVHRLIDALSRAAGAASSREQRAKLWTQVATLQSTVNDDAGAAIAAAKKGCKEQPTDVDARMLLSRLYEGSGRWQDCVQELSEVVKLSPPAPTKFQAHLMLAQVEFEHLQKFSLAARDVKAALEIDPADRDARELKIKVHVARNELSEAAEAAKALVDMSGSPVQKATAFMHSGDLEARRGDSDRAVTAYAGAVEMVGLESQASGRLKALLAEAGAGADWGVYTAALASFVRKNEGSPPVRCAQHRELGTVLLEKLKDTDAGLSHLHKALELAPDDQELRADLAQRLASAGRYERAVVHYVHLLRLEPASAMFWRALSECYAGMSKTEAARLALAPLVSRLEATEAEHATYGAHPVQVFVGHEGGFDMEKLSNAGVDEASKGPALDLLTAVAPAVSRLYPIDLQSYGLSTRDRVTSRSDSPIRRVADKIAEVLKVTDFDLYVHSANAPTVALFAAEKPTLLVSAGITELSESERVFLLARPLAHVARRSELCEQLTPSELERLLAAVARKYVPGFGSDLDNVTDLDELARRVDKAMPWFRGNKLEQAARAFATAGVDVSRWCWQADLTASQVAAVLCDDLAVALSLVQRSGKDDAFMERLSNAIIDRA